MVTKELIKKYQKKIMVVGKCYSLKRLNIENPTEGEEKACPKEERK